MKKRTKARELAFVVTFDRLSLMDLMLLRVFQRQVLLQCNFLLRAGNDIDAALRKKDLEGTFYAIQNLLNAAANISKALWGQAGKLTNERQDLRDSLGIRDNSPLGQITMRNDFEHFDERLDRWWKESKNHNNVDRNLGPLSGISWAEDIDRFRNFDPATGELTFWSQQFNLRQLISEVQRILPKLLEETSKPHWEK